jgi:hypothetical protein
MSQWIAKARKDYFCDICGCKIPKGSQRKVEGYRCPAYVMIDKNICSVCADLTNSKT